MSEAVTPMIQAAHGGSLSTALAKAQGQMQHAKLDGANPHFQSKYSTLASVIDAVRKPLSDNGIAFLQRSHIADDGVRIETIFLHTSGEELSAGSVFIPVDKRNAHGIGSALTYAKRYGLAMACGIAADEDDDGNTAVSAPPPRRASAVEAALDGVELDHEKVSEYVAGIIAALHNEDDAGLKELLDELADDQDLKLGVWAKLDAPSRRKIKEISRA